MGSIGKKTTTLAKNPKKNPKYTPPFKEILD